LMIGNPGRKIGKKHMTTHGMRTFFGDVVALPSPKDESDEPMRSPLEMSAALLEFL
jgi:hypothetical protein